MRILMLGIKEYPYGASSAFEKYPGGGTARYMLPFAEELAKRGHDVHIVVRKMKGQEKHEIIDGLHVHRVGWIPNRYLRLPSFNLLSFFKSIGMMGAIDIIHCHGSFSPYFGAILGKMYDKKVICTPHGTTSYGMRLKYHPFLIKLVEGMEKSAFSRLDMLLFLNEEERKNICSTLDITPENHAIILPGIPLPQSTAIEKNGKFRIIFIGRLVSVKRLDNLIRAVHLLPEKIQKKVELVILGEGYAKEGLIALTKKLGLKKIVTFPGYANDIYPYLKGSDVFVLPSEREGFPCSVLEALSCGVPVVTKDLGLPINSTYTVKDNSPSSLSEAIATLFKDKKLRAALRVSGLKEFQENFSLQRMVEEHEKIYSKLYNR